MHKKHVLTHLGHFWKNRKFSILGRRVGGHGLADTDGRARTDRQDVDRRPNSTEETLKSHKKQNKREINVKQCPKTCLLYTSDAADE